MPFRNYFCIWFLTRGIKAEKLYHIVNQMKIGSAVADKHERRAASRRTLSVINLRPNYKMTTLRVESRQVTDTAPIFHLPHMHLAPPLGETPFAFVEIFRIRKLDSLGSCGVIYVIRYV